MPVTPTEAVRPFQLPTPTSETPYLSQFNLAANTPISVTPGFGAASTAQLPPIQTGTTHFDTRTTFYVTAAQSERRTQ